jgi:hypothetical protein
MISPFVMIKQANLTPETFKYLTIALFSIGLLIRIISLPMYSTSDIGSWIKWGKITQESGLAKSFQGAYFPIQYIVFQSAYVISEHIGVNTGSLIKIYNLIFEIGLLCLIIILTKRHIKPWKIILVYWLNPFSLILFEQGYVDPQVLFFIILSITIIIKQISRYPYLLAGLPLGIAFLMKPQATGVFIGLTLLFITFLISKEINNFKKALGLLVFPAIFFISFSLYFGLNMEMKGHKTLPLASNFLQEKLGLSSQISDTIAKSSWLSIIYAYTPNNMPAINGYMPNAWFFVAESLRPSGTFIFRVADTQKFIGITYRNWGLILLLAVLIILMINIRRHNNQLKWQIALIMLIMPFLIPYLVTGAHENHFYYGFISMIILGSLMSDKLILYSAYLLGVLNGLNMLYLFVLPHYTNIYFDILYPTTARVSIIGASSLIFFIMLYYLSFKAQIVEKANNTTI